MKFFLEILLPSALGCVIFWLALPNPVQVNFVGSQGRVVSDSSSSTPSSIGVPHATSTLPQPAWHHIEGIDDYITPKMITVNMFSKAECEEIVRLCSLFPLQDGTVEQQGENYQVGSAKHTARRTSGVAIGKAVPEFSWVYKKIVDNVVHLNSMYWKHNIASDFRAPLIEHIQFQVYNSSNLGHYNWHQDNGVRGTFSTRKISITVQLSDPGTYEGGLLMMKGAEEEVAMSTQLGAAIVFPSYMLHKVSPVTKGVRRSMAIWFQEPHPTVFPPSGQQQAHKQASQPGKQEL